MIFDVLTTAVVPGQMDFTATTPGAPQLPVSITAGPIAFANARGYNWFEPGDNLHLIRMSVNLPYGFGPGIGGASMRPYFEDGAALLYDIPEFAEVSFLDIPDPCDGLEFPGDGLFIAMQTHAINRFRLVLDSFNMNVSQVNLPTVLNGQVIPVTVSALVVHTKPMQIGP